jgi:aromatic-L-amino-acid decarboxylase
LSSRFLLWTLPHEDLSLFEHSSTLDPSDWDSFRRHSHRALDDILDYVVNIRQRPVWQPAPSTSEAQFQLDLPTAPRALEDVLSTFQEHVLPYAVGNTHPGFMGWVHGGGNVVGMLADLLAAGLNSNLGGRDHIPIAVEQQVVRWMAELFQFPPDSSGLFVTGSSLANWIGILVARTAALGQQVRATGLRGQACDLTAYTSRGTHTCIAKALDMSGIGSNQLRRISTDANFRIDLAELRRSIAADRRAGLQPFCVVGNAGTVDTGAVDDLAGLAALCRQEKLWFHVDGACGALGMLAEPLRARFAGIEQADSLALDFHKWAQVPYDAGFVLVRDPQLHRATFTTPAAYLGRTERGLAAGSPWPCDFGPDLSRNFKALKVWFTLQVYGTQRLGEMISNTCNLAQALQQRIIDEPELELLAPVSLNIVCFRFRSQHAANQLNSQLVIELQESGLVAPSCTEINGQTAIRAAIFNHRTTLAEIHTLVDATLRLGRQLSGEGTPP